MFNDNSHAEAMVSVDPIGEARDKIKQLEIMIRNCHSRIDALELAVRDAFAALSKANGAQI